MLASWSPTPLIPPFRFGTVEPEVYRGAYPKQRNLRFLKRLKLRTILSLIPDAPDAVFQEFCTQQGIRSIHLPVDKVKDNVPLTYNRAVEAVQIIINQENLPIYIHCLDGASVTGLVICCLRKLQTWNISSAMGEFLRYLRGGVISSEESAFVEKFSSEIEISKPIPPWLWDGLVTFKKHPTLKLKFTIPPAAAAASNATNTSASPTLSNQNIMAIFPSHHGDGTNYGNNTTLNSVTNGWDPSTHGVNDDGTGISNLPNPSLPGSGSGQGGINSGSSLASPMGLQSHASRFAAKGSVLRDRPNNNKTAVRTDISGYTGYGSRSISIATPTMAALSRSKLAMASNSSVLGQQQHQLSSQDQTTSNATALLSDTGIKSKNTSQVSADFSGSGTGLAQAAAGTGGANTGSSGASSIINADHRKQGSSSTQGGGHGSGASSEVNPAKEGGSNVGQVSEENSTDSSTMTTQDRSINGTANPKSLSAVTPTPAPATEVADECYEVSMTLKALALEGADF
ncbi:hypothetical protein BGX27_007915 [Mortierella sp. AM989]|nr:hypothetical protein BGX27_007915 [Mortierella sp. AM989]